MSSWSFRALSEVLSEKTRNGIHKGTEYQGQGVPVIKMGEVYSSPYVGVGPHRDLLMLSEAEIEKLSVRPDDLLFCRTSLVAEGVGRCALVRDVTPGTSFASNLIRVRIDSTKADCRFIHWVFRSPLGEALRMSIARGTSVTTITGPDLAGLLIPLPPLPEQRAIAEVLGALDDKIESNRRVVQNVMKLSTTLFNKWRSTVSDWNITTFGEFASVYGGATPKTGSPEYWDGPHCWLTPTDVTHLDSIYLSSSARTITDEGLASASTEVHPPGTILMTSRATIGAFAVNQVPCAPNQGFIAVRPANAGQRWFLFHEMSRRVPEMLDRANGTTFREISRGSFKSMELLVPDDDNAFGRLDSELSPLHERAAQAVSETSCLAATRDTLLPALLSGRIRIPVAAELMEAS